MSNTIKIIAASAMIAIAALVIGYYLWPEPAAGKNLPVVITCLSCGHEDGTTWEDVLAKTRRVEGEVSGYFLPCTKCGKQSYVHRAEDPVPEDVRRWAEVRNRNLANNAGQ